MTNVDQFESVFRSAVKEVFSFQPVSIDSVLVITDLADDAAEAIDEEIKQFLSVLMQDGHEPEWDMVSGTEFDSIDRLKSMVEERSPELICTSRHVYSGRHRSPFTLGDFAAMLTQATTVPVLLIPHPGDVLLSDHTLCDTRTVMAMTSHLTGDNQLVNWALRFTEKNGTLFLTHIEDAAEFERYIDAISKISELNTDVARQMIHRQLLKEPADFIQSCIRAAKEGDIPIHIEPIVAMGHHLNQYKQLVADHAVRLLVMNTKDEDQLAMHGLAYPLAVELRETPLLLL